MENKQEQMYELIERIDNELLILSQAKEAGRWVWFDFKGALCQLRDILEDMGYNVYRKNKVSEYTHVFNELRKPVQKKIGNQYVRMAMIDYLLLDCEVESEEANKKISCSDSFSTFFGVDGITLEKNYINFKQYVQSVKAERALEVELKERRNKRTE